MSRVVEYRVRPVVRYVVTRFESGECVGGGSYGQSEVIGEFDNEHRAELVSEAMRKSEPESLT